jgi:hypothetical protein
MGHPLYTHSSLCFLYHDLNFIISIGASVLVSFLGHPLYLEPNYWVGPDGWTALRKDWLHLILGSTLACIIIFALRSLKLSLSSYKVTWFQVTNHRLHKISEVHKPNRRVKSAFWPLSTLSPEPLQKFLQSFPDRKLTIKMTIFIMFSSQFSQKGKKANMAFHSHIYIYPYTLRKLSFC